LFCFVFIIFVVVTQAICFIVARMLLTKLERACSCCTAKPPTCSMCTVKINTLNRPSCEVPQKLNQFFPKATPLATLTIAVHSQSRLHSGGCKTGGGGGGGGGGGRTDGRRKGGRTTTQHHHTTTTTQRNTATQRQHNLLQLVVFEVRSSASIFGGTRRSVLWQYHYDMYSMVIIIYIYWNS